MTSQTSERLTSGMLRGGLVLALAMMLGWAPAPVAAQATGTLVGTVRDAASQRPLEAVQVYIGGTGIGALTNAACPPDSIRWSRSSSGIVPDRTP